MENKKNLKIESKKRITRYPDNVKIKAVQLYREGKSVLQIVEELNGPKEKPYWDKPRKKKKI